MLHFSALPLNFCSTRLFQVLSLICTRSDRYWGCLPRSCWSSAADRSTVCAEHDRLSVLVQFPPEARMAPLWYRRVPISIKAMAGFSGGARTPGTHNVL